MKQKREKIGIYDKLNDKMINRDITYHTLIYPHERIVINDKIFRKPRPMVYALWKPEGMRCDLLNDSPILTWLQAIQPDFRLNLIGRLENKTQGIIFATNDGLFYLFCVFMFCFDVVFFLHPFFCVFCYFFVCVNRPVNTIENKTKTKVY